MYDNVDFFTIIGYLTQIIGIFCAVVGVVIIVSKGNWHVLSQMNFSVGEGG